MLDPARARAEADAAERRGAGTLWGAGAVAWEGVSAGTVTQAEVVPSVEEVGDGSLAAEAYGTNLVFERHRHRWEFNNAYRGILEGHGLRVSGTSPDGSLVEISEIREHPFMLGTQFHPELQSRPDRPHPLFRDFVRAAVGLRDAVPAEAVAVGGGQ